MRPGARRFTAWIAALGVALTLQAAEPQRARTEANLKALTERIQREQQRVQKDEVEKNRLTRDLRNAERSVSKAQGDLTRLRAQRAERNAARAALEQQLAEQEAEHQRTTAELGRQLRAAYFMGRHEPLKLLLNQQNPAEFSRNLAYYGYLGRLRADQIADINANIAKIGELKSTIEKEDAELARLEAEQQQQVGELEDARRQRGQVLASLEKESRNRATSLKRMRDERAAMERLLERLSQTAKDFPYDPKAPFAQTRRTLSWPVAGRIIVNYGAPMAGFGPSDGIDIDTDHGSPVRAIHEGRVDYADWVPQRGQTVIINHGNGYQSIYTHLDQLNVEGGSRVAAGVVLGTAGDSGGRKRPGVHFEIRRNKVPVDPRGWFRSPAPPAG
jgi:septal ring factor EnvC (AmiA/AmiB activator)